MKCECHTENTSGEDTVLIPGDCSLIENGRVSILIKKQYTPVLLKKGIQNPGQLIACAAASDHQRFRDGAVSAPFSLKKPVGCGWWESTVCVGD